MEMNLSAVPRGHTLFQVTQRHVCFATWVPTRQKQQLRVLCAQLGNLQVV